MSDVEVEYDIKAKELEFSNIDKPILEVKHADLSRCGDSAYRSICPVCELGTLLVYRDQETYQILRKDTCILCGQRVYYMGDMPEDPMGVQAEKDHG